MCVKKCASYLTLPEGNPIWWFSSRRQHAGTKHITKFGMAWIRRSVQAIHDPFRKVTFYIKTTTTRDLTPVLYFQMKFSSKKLRKTRMENAFKTSFLFYSILGREAKVTAANAYVTALHFRLTSFSRRPSWTRVCQAFGSVKVKLPVVERWDFYGKWIVCQESIKKVCK